MDKVFAFGGSFNPPHVGHMLAIKRILNMGADRIHVFVRINEGVDIVDAATKMAWFERMKEDYKSTGWDKVIFHEAVSANVKGKQYSLETLKKSISVLHEQAGEHITHYYAGADYSKYRFFWKLFAGDTRLVIGPRDEGMSSTAIRDDLEGYRFMIPDYIYEDIKAARNKG